MKTSYNIEAPKPSFRPVTITIVCESVEELRALRSVGGGMSNETTRSIIEHTYYYRQGVTVDTIRNIVRCVAEAAEKALQQLGERR